MATANEKLTDPKPSITRIFRWKQGALGQATDDFLSREEPLEIRVKGESVAVTMRTPGHDEELALGFLLSEGVIAGPGDVLEVAPCQQGEAALLGNVLNVFLAPNVELDLAKLRRNVYASSSCGLCGKASIESVHGHFAPLVKLEPFVAAEILLELPDKLRAEQETFDKTGGLHAAGLEAWMGNAAGVPELQEDDAALGMNRIGDFAPSSNLLARIDARRSGIPSSGLNDRRCFGDNQATLRGALLIVFEVQQMRRVILLRGSHPGQRSHDDAVAELIRPDFQGREKRGGHHGSSGVCIKGFDALSQLAFFLFISRAHGRPTLR